MVPTGLPALLITPVHFAPPTPLALQPTRHAAIGMAAVARAADVEQTPTSAVTAKTLSENDFPTARAHSTVLSLDSTPAIVASFEPLVARASFAGGGPPKTPVALDDRGFFFARTISRKRVARLTARMMTGPAQLDGWSENCGFTGSATMDERNGPLDHSALENAARFPQLPQPAPSGVSQTRQSTRAGHSLATPLFGLEDGVHLNARLLLAGRPDDATGVLGTWRGSLTDQTDIVLDVSSLPRVATIALTTGFLQRLIPNKTASSLYSDGVNLFWLFVKSCG